MSGLVKTFRDLDVYQSAMQLALDIHGLAKAFPAEERYVLADQMRRASRSVAANISEAWRKRRYQAAFVARLNDAETEAAEMQAWLDFSLKAGYIDITKHEALDARYEHLLAQIVTMIRKAKQWCNITPILRHTDTPTPPHSHTPTLNHD
ncbi:MAG: four helix bundle protein [Candidatus Marinimicrobia bacterium]|nr:four helix bundle protein [Candidatus Neomarinimicrobiota bacterium]